LVLKTRHSGVQKGRQAGWRRGRGKETKKEKKTKSIPGPNEKMKDIRRYEEAKKKKKRVGD